MLPYPVWQLALGLIQLRDLEWSSKRDVRQLDQPVPTEAAQGLRERLSHKRQQYEDIELGMAVKRTDTIMARLILGLTVRELSAELRFLSETIQSELQSRQFVFVPTAKAEQLDHLDRDWGAALTAFPSAADDIKAAVECYALDCNTACVFHSMRVAERGLRVLAKALKLKTIGPRKHPLEFAEWGQILSALAGKLKVVQGSPGRSIKKAAVAKFYADAASQADYLNEIWRKEVSHARGMYNAPRALDALTRTRDFMNLLSRHLSETKPNRLP